MLFVRIVSLRNAHALSCIKQEMMLLYSVRWLLSISTIYKGVLLLCTSDRHQSDGDVGSFYTEVEREEVAV